MKVDFIRKPEPYKTKDVTIVAIEKLPDNTFQSFLCRPLLDYDFIEKHGDELGYDDVSGKSKCLLITSESGSDAVVVDCQGYSYARYASYVPNGKYLAQLTPALESALQTCNHIVDHIVEEACEKSHDGSYVISFDEIGEWFDMDFTFNKLLTDHICDSLEVCAEVEDVDLERNGFALYLDREYCKNLDPAYIHEDNVRVVIIQPGEVPIEATIPNTLKSFQEQVGGMIEYVGQEDGSLVVVNEEGKLMDFEPNRWRHDEEIFVGPMVIVGNNEELGDFCSLTDEQVAYNMGRYEAIPTFDEADLVHAEPHMEFYSL